MPSYCKIFKFGSHIVIIRLLNQYFCKYSFKRGGNPIKNIISIVAFLALSV